MGRKEQPETASDIYLRLDLRYDRSPALADLFLSTKRAHEPIRTNAMPCMAITELWQTNWHSALSALPVLDDPYAMADAILDKLVWRLGIGKRHADASYRTFRMLREGLPVQDLVDIIQWRGEGTFLTLSGPPGTGKTHLAVAKMRQAIIEGVRSARFFRVPYLMHSIKQGFGTEVDILEGAIGAQLLVLDDLGSERVTDFVADQLYVLLGERYAYDRPTIVTSNLGLDDISKLIDDRVASRLASGLVVDFGGINDYRVTGGA